MAKNYGSTARDPRGPRKAARPDQTSTIHVIDADGERVPGAPDPGAASDPTDETNVIPRREIEAKAAPLAPADVPDLDGRARDVTRRRFVALSAVLLGSAAAGAVWWRLRPQEVPASQRPETESDEVAKPTTDTEPQQVDESEKKKDKYEVPNDLKPGSYVIRAKKGAKEGWARVAGADVDDAAAFSWPAVPVETEATVTLSDGFRLMFTDEGSLASPSPATDLKDLPLHAGLFLVGTDIREGTYELTPMSADDWCRTSFGPDMAVDDLHPTLWHKTCARAASATRAAGLSIDKWLGYVLADAGTGSDPGRVTEAGPASVGLLSEDRPAVRIEGTLGDDSAVDSYLAWMRRLGHVPIDGTVTVDLKAGQVFGPVMCTVKRKG